MLDNIFCLCLFFVYVGIAAGVVKFLLMAAEYGGVDVLGAIHDLMMWTPRA